MAATRWRLTIPRELMYDAGVKTDGSDVEPVRTFWRKRADER
jgi:hypothetical protein